MKKVFAVVALLIVTATVMAGSTPQTQIPPPEFKIKIEVSGDGAVKEKVQSYLSREFRTIPDCKIVDSGESYTVGVVVLPQSLNGVEFGYILTYWVEAPLNVSKVIQGVIDRNPNMLESDKVMLRMLIGLCEEVTNLSLEPYLVYGPVSDLKETCNEIVATVDNKLFEASRKWTRTMNSRPLPNFNP